MHGVDSARDPSDTAGTKTDSLLTAFQADEILQLTRELSTAKQETLQSDLAVARSEAAPWSYELLECLGCRLV